MGLSEVELFKNGGQFDETTLKIPGYTLLFPKSWTVHSFARVVVYVKNNLEYVQVPELEDNLIQSIWIKGGFKRGKKVYYCHGYREHTSTDSKCKPEFCRNCSKTCEDYTGFCITSTENRINKNDFFSKRF